MINLVNALWSEENTHFTQNLYNIYSILYIYNNLWKQLPFNLNRVKAFVHRNLTKSQSIYKIVNKTCFQITKSSENKIMRVINYYYACCCLISYDQAMLRFVSVSPVLDMLYVITKCYPSTELYCSCGFTNESVSFSFIKAILSCQNSYNNSHWYTSEIWTLFGRRKHKIPLCHIQPFYKNSGRLYNFSKIQLHTDYLHEPF